MPWEGVSHVSCCSVGDLGLESHHVAGLGGATGEDQDGLGAVGRGAILEVVAGCRALAGFELRRLVNREGTTQGGHKGENKAEGLHDE